MKRRYLLSLTVGLLLLMPTPFGWAQDPSLAAVQQILLSHVGTVGLPQDITIQAQFSDGGNNQPLRILIKGKTKVRYELGTGARTTISTYNAGAAWTGSATAMKALPQHIAL